MRLGDILAVSVIALFLILGLIRLYPYHNSLPSLLESELNDDWVWYARLSLDIKNGETPAIPVSYRWPLPSGFLYYYFIAFCFKVFGENTAPVYLVQHLTIGISCAAMYWAFREKMRPVTGMFFLLGLALFSLLDIYKNYAARLLSENLTFFIMPLFFLCFIKGFERDDLRLQFLSASLLGLAISTRANIIFFAAALITLIAPFYMRKRGPIYPFLFAGIMFLAISSVPLMNYSISGKWNLFPNAVTGTMQAVRTAYPVPADLDLAAVDRCPFYRVMNRIERDISVYAEYMRQRPAFFFGRYIKNIIFSLGFCSVLSPSYRWRPHWMVMWIGYFLYLFLRFRKRRPMELWEAAAHLYILFYYGSVILLTNIHNYGFRFLAPAINFVLIFLFLALDELSGKRERGIRKEMPCR